MVALPPSTAPPHGQDGVSVHSGSRERERCGGDSGGGLRHLGRGRQPPLVLKPETTRSGLIYRERRGKGAGEEEEEGRETRSTEEEGGGMEGLQDIKTLRPVKRIIIKKKKLWPRPKWVVTGMDGGWETTPFPPQNDRNKKDACMIMLNTKDHRPNGGGQIKSGENQSSEMVTRGRGERCRERRHKREGGG